MVLCSLSRVFLCLLLEEQFGLVCNYVLNMSMLYCNSIFNGCLVVIKDVNYQFILNEIIKKTSLVCEF